MEIFTQTFKLIYPAEFLGKDRKHIECHIAKYHYSATQNFFKTA